MRFDNPTAAIMPKSPQYMAPTTGPGMVVKIAPNLVMKARIIITVAPHLTTWRLATRVRPMAPIFSE